MFVHNEHIHSCACTWNHLQKSPWGSVLWLPTAIIPESLITCFRGVLALADDQSNVSLHISALAIIHFTSPPPQETMLGATLIISQKNLLWDCFPKLVLSARAPYFISVSHWLLCVIFDTLLWVLFTYVIPWSVKNSLFSRRSCSYPAVFLFSLKLRESLQLQGKMKNKSRNNIPA